MVAFKFKRIYGAYLACRKRKRATSQAQHYDLHLLDELVWASESLQKQTRQPRRTACFITIRPKAREIHAAAFADRVIHHLLVPHLEKLYEPIFIHDSYSNRKNKGTHKAVERLQQFMRQVTCNQKRRAYYLQLDIHNFFNSVDKGLLFQLIQQRLHDPQLLWLCRTILEHNPCLNVKEYGGAKKFAKVPAHKRLKNAPQGKGLPIGNLTSQFFANLYMNELDQFVKHHLKCKHYLRYVDDFILLHEDKAQLEAWREVMIVFLHERLGLRLKDRGKFHPISNGADFLGYIVRPHYCLVRRRVVGNLREKLSCFEHKIANLGGLSYIDYSALQAILASYLGHFRHASSYRLVHSLWRQYPWLSRYFLLIHPIEYRGALRKKNHPKIILSFSAYQAQKKARFNALSFFPLENNL